jgi:CRP-like cAMP-binding protein
MALDDDIAILERVPTLSLLGHEPLRILAIGAESRRLREDEVLFRQGDKADCGYVVQEGSLALVSADGRTGRTTAHPGTLIGEIAMLTDTVRPVTATARENTTVMRIPRPLFLKVLQGYPDAAVRLREALVNEAERVREDLESIRQTLASAGLP